MRIPFFNKASKVDDMAGHVAGERIRAGFDAASRNPQEERYWANADGMSADAVASPDVRRLLRNRARYEVANNCYAAGMKSTTVKHTIGTGARLQINTGDTAMDRRLEAEWIEWADEISLADKLSTFRGARFESGECFGILTKNHKLKSRNKTDIVMIEADQIASPLLASLEQDTVDGIEYDQFGNPSIYHVLDHHPGSNAPMAGAKSRPVRAASVIHYFKADRPGQSRGIPDITPALPSLGQLRRYTKATLSAAELVASLSMFMSTQSPPGGEAEGVKEFSLVDIEPGVLLTLPAGWEAGQIKAEQPVTAYAEFKHEILNEAARCVDMPFNLAAGNSSTYNYASGRLDHQSWFQAIKGEREFIERVILNKIFEAWLAEEILIERVRPILSPALRLVGAKMPKPSWHWDGFEHVDPLKEANAQATRLGALTASLQSEYAKQGKDWQTELEQIAKEKKLMAQLGLTLVAPSPQVDEPEDKPEPKEGAANAA